MTIPGINNIDTYKYIYHSMYHMFKSFSLQYLCNILDLGVGKLDSTRIMTMTMLDWLKLVTIKGVRKTRIEHYNLPLPRFATNIHDERQEQSIR